MRLQRSLGAPVPKVRLVTHEASGVGPGLALDLLRVLVTRGNVAYVGGTFTVPYDLDVAGLSDYDASMARPSDPMVKAIAVARWLEPFGVLREIRVRRSPVSLPWIRPGW